MSLTQQDLDNIRTINRDEITRKVDPIDNEVKAMRNDIKEIYDMVSDFKGKTITDEDFEKLSKEEKLLTLNAELIAVAKASDITLPRS